MNDDRIIGINPANFSETSAAVGGVLSGINRKVKPLANNNNSSI
jgi:hypothetical protein